MGKPLVSVVIPTYNSATHLWKCLRSIDSQTYSNIETIIVDGYSEDRTVEIARRFDVEIIQNDGSRGKARNEGIKIASGEYLLTIDSDMELSSEVISRCVKSLQDEDTIAGVVIPERSIGDSFWVGIRDFERQFYSGTGVESPRFFPMDLVYKHNGYDEDLIFYEESTLPKKLAKSGYDVMNRIDAQIYHHEEDFSLKDWLWKKYYYGQTAFQFISRYNNVASPQINPISRIGIFLKRPRRLINRPIYGAGTLALKVMEFGATSAGILKARLRSF